MGSGILSEKVLRFLFTAVVLLLVFNIASYGSTPDRPILPDTLHHNDTTITFSKDTLEIDRIFIVGNRKTKERIILRELSFQKGSILTAAELLMHLENDQSKLLNLRLFNVVEFNPVEIGAGKVVVVLRVNERWYFFPVPLFELVDRNFNDWWVNRDRDLSRVNYGVRLYQENFRGRNERIRATARFGFANLFDLQYAIPNIGNKQQHGASIKIDYSDFNAIAFRSIDHVPEFYESEKTLRSSRGLSLGYNYRKSFYDFHFLEMGFRDNRINDTIAVLNPDFFLDGRTRQQYFHMTYRFLREKRNFISYPLRGYYLRFELSKLGLGIYDDLDWFSATFTYAKYWDLKKDYYLSNYSSIFISGPEIQPYQNLRGMGLGSDFVRGYELFFIESQNFMINKTTFKKKIFSYTKEFKRTPLEQFRYVPLSIFLKTYTDIGYGANLTNYANNDLLSDKFLLGSGLGLDIVTFYDMVLRLEYSFTIEGDSGFFFHIKREF